MRFLFVFNFPEMKEGILGLSIRNTTLFCNTLIIIKIFLTIDLLIKSDDFIVRNTNFFIYVFYTFKHSLQLMIFCLFLLFVNIITKKVKQLFFLFNFFVNLLLVNQLLITISLPITVFYGEKNKDNSIPFKIQRSFDLLFIYFSLWLIDILLYFPIWCYSIHLKKRNYKILDKTNDENKEEMELRVNYILQSKN